MKKLLISATVAGCLLSTLVANEKSGVFVGVQAGAPINYISGKASVSTSMSSAETSETHIETSWLVGGRIGYQQYFNDYNGLRLYGTVDYSRFSMPGLDNSPLWNNIKYGVILDYLLNFSSGPSPWGLFIGGGYQWLGGEIVDLLKDAESPAKSNNQGFVVNAGISKIISDHNRIEIGARVPMYSMISEDYSDSTTGIKATMSLRNAVDIYVAYSYSF